MRKCSMILFFVLFLVSSGLALGQGTPDWITPSRETVCDGESGAAFGLCNAYCEAMDCHLAEPQASQTACDKVSDKFTQVTGRNVPCTPCPCTSIPEFDAYLTGIATINSCLTDPITQLTADLTGYVGTFAASGDLNGPFCGFIGETLEGDQVVEILMITPEEEATCRQALESAASAQGVPCS